MKKYFIIAALALVALTACSKIEVSNDVPDKAISFQVANYVAQTKAGESAFDINDTFKTSAWFHPTSGDAQVFMDKEVIKWQAARDPKQWASDRIYFWPKTGYVNFYSWAGSPEPVVTYGAAKYGDAANDTYITIATDADAMLANGAFRYASSSSNTNLYNIEYESVDVTGVPTLFHHMLSKVTFIVKFDATGLDAKNKWDLTINSAALIYANQGALAVNFTDPTSTGIANWPFSATAVNWTMKSGANTTLAVTENLGDSNKQTTVGGNVSEGKTLLNEITVLPQDLTAATGSNARLAINYTLKHYYNTGTDAAPVWTEQIFETVNLFDPADPSNPGDALGSVALTQFTTEDVTAWNMNYKYIYTVKIKPNKTVTFDPAVVDWVETVNTSFTYPND